MDNNKKEFKPYIPADKVVPEFTVTALLIGILLAIVFGAANAYLGLLVGMTVSASIPAAVISMGIIRVILRKDSILENNMVQTIGSAGESVAAGALHIQLGGTHDYFGKPVEKPTIGDDLRPVEPEDIKRTNQLLYGAAICSMGVVSLIKGLSFLHKQWKRTEKV